ncbi:MAG TPA: DUF2807 domain-containing protein [Caulobacteraceae bacterium]|jgi:hypothetical protein
MKALIALALLGAAVPAGASAAEVHLRDVIAEVRIIPEARGDFAVSIANAHPGLPQMRVSRTASGVLVDGGLHRRLNSCGMMSGIKVKNGPTVSKKNLPRITIRAPQNFAVRASGYVRGQIGAAQAVKLNAEGCGDWGIGQTSQRLEIDVEGVSHIDAASARSADLSLEGVGDIDLASVNGALDASVEGVGHIRVKAGRATAMRARLEGMGGIRFDGVADTLDASAEGIGSINVPNTRTVLRKSLDGLAKIRTSR